VLELCSLDESKGVLTGFNERGVGHNEPGVGHNYPSYELDPPGTHALRHRRTRGRVDVKGV
jgi:hypothetical protein